MSSQNRVLKREQIVYHLEQQKSSGQTVVAYCEQQGLKVNTFRYWQKRHRKENSMPGFRKITTLKSSDIFSNSSYEIELNGIKIKVPFNFDRASFLELVSAVKSL